MEILKKGYNRHVEGHNGDVGNLHFPMSPITFFKIL